MVTLQFNMPHLIAYYNDKFQQNAIIQSDVKSRYFNNF